MTPPATPTRHAGPAHVVLLGAANSVHLQRWAQALHGRGRRVDVVTQHAAGALPLPDGVALHALPVAHGSGYLLNAPALRRLLGRLRPDLLHVHYASGYGTLARLARWRPTLLSVWGSDVYEFPDRGALQRRWLVANLRAAGALASTSEAMAARVRALLGEPDRPIALTPFGVDTERFAPPGADGPAAAEGDPGAGAACPTIGTVKTLAPTYGIDLLLRAFARVRATRPCRLLLVGDGPQRAALQRLAATLGVADAVRFVGAVPHAEVPRWLGALDVYVAPSRHESFGVAVVEAMACGRAVVVSDAGGLPEVVEDGRSGLVVPTGDVGALAAAIARLADDAALRRTLGVAARARAAQRYAWPACVDRMLACQDSVIDSSARPPRPPRA